MADDMQLIGMTHQHSRHSFTLPDQLRWALGLMLVSLSLSGAAQSPAATLAQEAATAGPIRLRQPQIGTDLKASTTGVAQASPNRTAAAEAAPPRRALPPPPPPPGDFDLYVRRLNNDVAVPRLGIDALQTLGSVDATDGASLVPPDYILRAGDELLITIWGAVDADMRLQIDRSGRIVIPRVGPAMLAGVRYDQAAEVITRRVGQVFKNFQISVTLGQLRGMRVYVTGFVQQPGVVWVNSLATVAHALFQAGGPSAAGTFRSVQLRRARAPVLELDFYDLLLKGEQRGDQLLQADDVVHVGPIGPQVALFGSVNRSAIFELKSGETVADLLRMAGGFSPVADSSRLTLDRFGDRNSSRTIQVDLPKSAGDRPLNGDVYRAFNAADVARPSERQNKRVRIEGEVQQPGDYLLPPNSTLADALRAAGGTTANAYLYATMLTRESAKRSQQENYERAIRDMESQLVTSNATRRTSTPEEAAAVNASAATASRFIEQLRNFKPNGRIIFQLTPESKELPELVLEDGDRLAVPARQHTVGVFGSVYSAGSYLHSSSRTIRDYLRLAGGPTKGSDEASIFVVRANGIVASSQQNSGWLSRGNQIAALTVEPGDTIFVPEEFDKAPWVQHAKDWTQILYQFGIGLAGIVSAVK